MIYYCAGGSTMSHTEMVGLRIVENTGKPRRSMIQSGISARYFKTDGLQEAYLDPRKGDEI
jgi:hypothetical protein